jgi:hypothetical protein
MPEHNDFFANCQLNLQLAKIFLFGKILCRDVAVDRDLLVVWVEVLLLFSQT